jgi:hypothetical protein
MVITLPFAVAAAMAYRRGVAIVCHNMGGRKYLQA